MASREQEAPLNTINTHQQHETVKSNLTTDHIHPPSQNSSYEPQSPESPNSLNQQQQQKERYRFPPWLIIITWISLSTSVIFYNALILKDWGFHYPVTLTTLHLTFQTISTQLLARFTNLIPNPTLSDQHQYTLLPSIRNQSQNMIHHNLNQQQDSVKSLPSLPRDVFWKKVVPIAILFSLSLVLSNAVYLYLSIAFIQMIKAASPVAVLLTSFAFGLYSPSLKLFGIVLLISFGIGIASYGEVAFSWLGFLIQVIAIIIEANRVVLIQLLLGTGMTPLTSLYFFAPVCLVINLMLVFPLEGIEPINAIPKLGIWVILSNTSLTFFLNISTVYLIQCSSLLLSLSKVLKDLILIVIGGFLQGLLYHHHHDNHDKGKVGGISPIQWIGYFICLIGLILYKCGI